jgi:hypothetical protein
VLSLAGMRARMNRQETGAMLITTSAQANSIERGAELDASEARKPTGREC